MVAVRDWVQGRSDHGPASLPRRINIGSRYQAEVPELRQRSAVELDHHGAELVWAPLNQLEEKQDYQQKGQESARGPRTRTDRALKALLLLTVNDLMHLACSSVFYGGGTNQELAHHCLHQCKGDIMVSIYTHTHTPVRLVL